MTFAPAAATTLTDYVVAAVAACGAGMVNALAGGGTLISFPALVAVGVPAVNANVTNTVALCPGYLAGTYAQRDDLRPQLLRARKLAVVGGIGGLAGSILLVLTPDKAFRAAVPWLILLACALLAGQDRIRALLRRNRPAGAGEGAGEVDADAIPATLGLTVVVFAAAVYGGFFGAGLGIMLLALLGLFSEDTLVRLNAMKQALSFVINFIAALFLVFSGHVEWRFAAVMAVFALVGGNLGGRLAQVVNPTALRAVVIVFGLAVALRFWLS